MLKNAYNLDVSPTIKLKHNNQDVIIANDYDNSLENLTISTGYVDQKGKIIYGDTWYVVTNYIPLKSKYDIEFSLFYQWGISYCCLYDINKNFLKPYVLGQISELSQVTGKMSELKNIPLEAVYAVFCSMVKDSDSTPLDYYIRCTKPTIVTTLKEKTGYFIGDSIMIGNDSIPTTLSITYFLKNKYGMNCSNIAKGGAVLTSSTKHYAPIYQMLTSIPDDADYIIIQGGVNGMAKEETEDAPWGWGSISDSYETEFDSTLQIPCLEAMCKYVITNFPTKKYGFIITYQISNWYDYWDEKSELIKQVLEKWGIPYLDWRQCGITLASQAVREQYGVDAFASYPEYSSSNTYLIDSRVLYQGKAYKAKQDINTPEDWTPEHWDLITETRYDGWHCNSKAYEQLADKTAAWMMNL